MQFKSPQRHRVTRTIPEGERSSGSVSIFTLFNSSHVDSGRVPALTRSRPWTGSFPMAIIHLTVKRDGEIIAFYLEEEIVAFCVQKKRSERARLSVRASWSRNWKGN